MRPAYLFVYGTLRRRFHHPFHRYLTRYAGYLGKAYARGSLYEIARYPGMVVTRHSRIVKGELYALRHPAKLFASLDRYEECSTEFPEPREYKRDEIYVRFKGRILLTHTYLYAYDVRHKRPILSGDYALRSARQVSNAPIARLAWYNRS